MLHIEDLPIAEFIEYVKGLKGKNISEKLDGAQLEFGLDENGVYTTREGKTGRSKKFYKTSDYAMVANFNAFRSAHDAILSVSDAIKKHLVSGDRIQIEVLFGAQPNTVDYGLTDSYIAILNPEGDTARDRFNALQAALKTKTATVKSIIVSSPDGKEILLDKQDVVWKFTSIKHINIDKVDFSEVNKLVDKLESFLKKKNAETPLLSNGELLNISLSKIKKENRDAVKKARERIQQEVLQNYKLPIKELLLGKIVKKIEPLIKNDDHLIGAEGVVVTDNITGKQVKIVDKDIFTAINEFNSTVRSHLSGSISSTDIDASLEHKGGSLGEAKIKVAELFGIKELALSADTKKIILKFKKDSAKETAEAMASSFHLEVTDSLKSQLVSIFEEALSRINESLSKFKKESDSYKLTLKNGKTIGITKAVFNKTLTAFAEASKNTKTIIAKIKSSSTGADIIMAIFSKQFSDIFLSEEGEPVVAPVTPTTTSQAIAPYPKKLFSDGKIIKRRLRTYKKSKKFAPPKVNEDLDTSVEDSKSVDKKFVKLKDRLDASDTVKATDVMKYLDHAHEVNDEVDTITFGMELDDNSVVKIHVNAKDADEFERVLGDYLGQETDAEKVIDELSDKFDIVAVDWPEGYKSTQQEEKPEEDSGEHDHPDINFDIEDGHDIGGEQENDSQEVDKYPALKKLSESAKHHRGWVVATLGDDGKIILNGYGENIVIPSHEEERFRHYTSEKQSFSVKDENGVKIHFEAGKHGYTVSFDSFEQLMPYAILKNV